MRFKRVGHFITVLAVGISSACGDAGMSGPPAIDPSNSLVAAPDATLDDFFEQVALSAPGGFGGMYRGADGELVVLLVNDRNQAAARDALMRYPGVVRAAENGIRFVAATYNFAELRSYARALENVWSISAVRTLDIAEDANILEIGLADASGVDEVRLVVAKAGIPEDAVRSVVVGEIQLDATLRDRFRPVPAGVEGTSPICTLGFNVEHYMYGRTVLVNSHCTQSTWAYDGVAVPQPVPGFRIGREVLDPPLATLPAGYGCPSGKKCRYSDAALVQYDDSVAYELGRIAKPTGLASLTVDPADPRFFVTQSYDSTCYFGPCQIAGDTISKVGRTTGWTRGTVNGTCLTVAHPDGGVLLCQYRGTYASGGGDSGSPVFSTPYIANGAIAYGIHWGSDGVNRYYSPTHGFRRDLGAFGETCTGLIIAPGPYNIFC